jgi:HAMP domain-containing protein
MAPHDDWLGDLRWQGYPRLDPVADLASKVDPGDPAIPPRPGRGPERVEDLAKENEQLRSRLDRLLRLASEFERRLEEAGRRYEDALLEAESRETGLRLEKERLEGERDGARAEAERRAAHEGALDGFLSLERGRREAAERELDGLRRRVELAEADARRYQKLHAEAAGALGELRRQASVSTEKLVLSKALTDQDVALLRQEMREFLAKFHRLTDPPQPPEPSGSAE